MARIVELKQYDNVTLAPGVMQNWVDLDVDGPSWSPLVAELASGVRGRVLVVGPHDVKLLGALADNADELHVVVRAAQDAGTITQSVPSAKIIAGNLAEVALAGETYDVVVAMDDLSRVLSAEGRDISWADLAKVVIACAAPGGTVLLGIENERGLHRFTGQIDTYAVNLDRDWTPFRTWDATRPRTADQLEAWLRSTGLPAQVWGLLPAWRKVDVLMAGAQPSPGVRDLAAAYALRGGASPMPWRSATLADRIQDSVAGWVVVLGGGERVADDVARTRGTSDAASREWTVTDGVARSGDGETRRLPRQGRTALIDLIEFAADFDTPAMRRVLTAWYEAILAHSSGDVVEATHADARLSNVYLDGDEVVFLEPAAQSAPLENVVWDALRDMLSIIQSHGLKHPWPTAMNRQTRLASLGAMAGAERPADLGPWVARVGDAGQSREELLAVIKRQQDELKSVWARWHWDEKQYAAYVAKANVKKTVKYAKRNGKQLPKVAAKRVATKAKASLRK